MAAMRGEWTPRSAAAESLHKKLSSKVDADGQQHKRELRVHCRPQGGHVGVLGMGRGGLGGGVLV